MMCYWCNKAAKHDWKTNPTTTDNIHTLFIIIKAGPAVKNSETANNDFDQVAVISLTLFLLVVS